MGSLYWQLNDVWPVTSWASVDFYHEWKALHYTVRHMFKNYMISVYPVKAKDGTQCMDRFLLIPFPSIANAILRIALV